MNTTIRKPVRQGDIWHKPIDTIPGNFTEVIPGTTIAFGTATGHHHSFAIGNVTIFGDPSESHLPVNSRKMVVDIAGVPIADVLGYLDAQGFAPAKSRKLPEWLPEVVKKIFAGKIQRAENCWINKKTKQITIIPDCKYAALLTHDEHRPRVVPAGLYRRSIQCEYSPSGAYQVID